MRWPDNYVLSSTGLAVLQVYYRTELDTEEDIVERYSEFETATITSGTEIKILTVRSYETQY